MNVTFSNKAALADALDKIVTHLNNECKWSVTVTLWFPTRCKGHAQLIVQETVEFIKINKWVICDTLSLCHLFGVLEIKVGFL